MPRKLTVVAALLIATGAFGYGAGTPIIADNLTTGVRRLALAAEGRSSEGNAPRDLAQVARAPDLGDGNQGRTHQAFVAVGGDANRIRALRASSPDTNLRLAQASGGQRAVRTVGSPRDDRGTAGAAGWSAVRSTTRTPTRWAGSPGTPGCSPTRAT